MSQDESRPRPTANHVTNNRGRDGDEPILRADSSRLVIYPIRYHDLWNLYKQAQASFWTVEEVDLGKDQFHALSPSEQCFLGRVLGFFAASDGIVIENLVNRFASEVQLPEARSFYAFQAAIENIHSEMYSVLIDTYFTEPGKKHELLNAIDNFECVKRKADWALQWITGERSFGERLVAFIAVEGIFFSGAFAAVFWFRNKNLLPGLAFSNELISRDEGLHCTFAIALLTHVTDRPSQSAVHHIFRHAVHVEKQFWEDSVPDDLLGMNSQSMCQYVEFVTDRICCEMNLDKIFHASNPFPFMEQISMEGKTNFFERRVGEYQRMGFSQSHKGEKSKDWTQFEFRTDLDF